MKKTKANKRAKSIPTLASAFDKSSADKVTAFAPKRCDTKSYK